MEWKDIHLKDKEANDWFAVTPAVIEAMSDSSAE